VVKYTGAFTATEIHLGVSVRERERVTLKINNQQEREVTLKINNQQRESHVCGDRLYCRTFYKATVSRGVGGAAIGQSDGTQK
jgi:hypothetical protein